MSVKIAPSLLSADFAELGAEADKAGADWLHLDVMDGHFVPNLTFGAPVVAGLRPCTRLPLDVHLMISEPARYMAAFAAAGADCVSWHLECGQKPAEVLKSMAGKRLKKGIAIKPATPLSRIRPWLSKLDFVVVMSVEPGFGGQAFMPDMLPKVTELAAWRQKLGLKFMVELDGGVDAGNAPLAIAAGADVLVAGSAVFKKKNYRRAIQALRG
jgi:ribulose-phosphate 3-epimerase